MKEIALKEITLKNANVHKPVVSFAIFEKSYNTFIPVNKSIIFISGLITMNSKVIMDDQRNHKQDCKILLASLVLMLNEGLVT